MPDVRTAREVPGAVRAGMRHVEHVMGTVVSFDVRDPVTPAIDRALRDAVRWLHQVDRTYSTYRPDSVVSALAAGRIEAGACPRQVRDVLELCEQARVVSDGWFSATAGGTLDPSGLVKGWAIEHCSDLLHAAGGHNTCVNGGGDMQLRGESAPGRPWRVAVADPLRAGELCTVVTGRDLAVATSGTAERGDHILDPRTGAPARGPASLTLTGPRLTMTDALATAAFAMGDAVRGWLARLPEYEAFAVLHDGTYWQSPGFPAAG